MRLLGAIVPHGERTWFFKLLGPAPAVGEQKETFDRFLASVQFPDKGERPITWTVPLSVISFSIVSGDRVVSGDITPGEASSS